MRAVSLWHSSQDPFAPSFPPELHATDAKFQVCVAQMLGLPSLAPIHQVEVLSQV